MSERAAVSRRLPSSEEGVFWEAIRQHSPRAFRWAVAPNDLRHQPNEAPLGQSRLLATSSCVGTWQTEQVAWHATGRTLRHDEIRPSQSIGFIAGDYYVQDAASMLPIELLPITGHEIIVDVAAAPGGKATAAAERLSDGLLIANEPIASRVAVLKHHLAKTGRCNWVVTQLDPESLATILDGTADIVIADVPCSGQALVQSGERATNAFDAAQISHSAARGRRILSAATRLLRPGGRLIYSTCTFADEENEEQMRWLSGSNAWMADPADRLSHWQTDESACYRLWPHRDACGGAFAARYQLTDRPTSEIASVSARDRSRSKRRRPDRARQQLRLPSGWEEWLTVDAIRPINARAEAVRDDLVMPAYAAIQRLIDSGVRLNATEILNIRGKAAQPSHETIHIDAAWLRVKQYLPVGRQAALSFAAGEAIPADDLPLSTTSPGVSAYVAVTWEGRPIGWGKRLPTRVNNLIPPIARHRLSDL